MIAKVSHGADVGALVRYLCGPGRRGEHTDPHVVAAWDAGFVRGGDLAADSQPLAGWRRLAQALDAPRLVHGSDVARPVYHVVISAHPGDGRLGSAIWRELCDNAVSHLGLGRCRWAAVHHGPSRQGCDHVHLVVQRVQPDGRIAGVWRDWPRWRAWCRQIEDRLRLTPTAPAGAGHAGTPRHELEHGRTLTGRPIRETLRREVHLAAVLATSEHDFAALLARCGITVRWRRDAAGRATGYSVEVTGPRTGREIRIAGSALRRDLSLPRLRHRWNAPALLPSAGLGEYLQAAPVELAGILARGGPGVWYAAAQLVADLARVAAWHRRGLLEAAEHLAAAAQPPRGQRHRGHLAAPVLRHTLHAVRTATALAGQLLVALVRTVRDLIRLLRGAAKRHLVTHRSALRHLAHAVEHSGVVELATRHYPTPTGPAATPTTPRTARPARRPSTTAVTPPARRPSSPAPQPRRRR